MYRPNDRPYALHRNASRGHSAVRRIHLVGRRAIAMGNARSSTCPSASTAVSRDFRCGARTSAAFTERPSTLVSCWCDGSSSARSVRSSVRTVATGTCTRRGVGTVATADRTKRRTSRPIRPSCTTRQVEPICRKYLELRYRAACRTCTRLCATRRKRGCRSCARCGCIIRRPDGRRARRRVSVGSRHACCTGVREGRDDSARLLAERRVVRLLDERGVAGGREIERRSRSRDTSFICARRRRHSDGAGEADVPTSRVRGARWSSWLSGCGRHVDVVRRRRPVVRLSEGRVDARRHDVA